MKKLFIFFTINILLNHQLLAVLTSDHLAISAHDLTKSNNDKDIPNNLASLSSNQCFELGYLSKELPKFAKLTPQQWSQKKSAQILLKRMQDALDNASNNSHPAFKQEIINIFEQYHINVHINSNNIITPQQSTHPKESKSHSEHGTKIHRSKSTTIAFNPFTKMRTFQRIHGARRTMRRLREKYKKEEEAKKRKETAKALPHPNADDENNKPQNATQAPSYKQQDVPQKNKTIDQKSDDFFTQPRINLGQ